MIFLNACSASTRPGRTAGRSPRRPRQTAAPRRPLTQLALVGAWPACRPSAATCQPPCSGNQPAARARKPWPCSMKSARFGRADALRLPRHPARHCRRADPALPARPAIGHPFPARYEGEAQLVTAAQPWPATGWPRAVTPRCCALTSTAGPKRLSGHWLCPEPEPLEKSLAQPPAKKVMLYCRMPAARHARIFRLTSPTGWRSGSQPPCICNLPPLTGWQ
jgi:hypothetical protein